MFLALKEMNNALNVSLAFNLIEEACEVYYSIAAIHLKIGQFDTAFTACTESLKIHPTAKVYHLNTCMYTL